MDWIPLFLMELAMLLGGVFGCLVGFRVYRGGGGDPQAWDHWYRGSGHWLRFVGPFCLLMAVVLPVVWLRPAFLPPWLPGVAAIGILVMALGFGVVTWRWEPRVGWPRGITSWITFLWLEPLVWSGIAMGILDFVGLDERSFAEHRLWAWYIGGLVFARIVRVWFTRFQHHARRGVEG